MSTATELRPLSLAERIAKVRGRMLVATLTKVPPSNKELFVALCRIYEQHEMERSSFSGELSDDLLLPLQALSFAHKIEENPRQQWPESVLMKPFHLGKVVDFDDNIDTDGEEFNDWDKAGR